MNVNAHQCAFAAASAVAIFHILYSIVMLYAPNQLFDWIGKIHYLAPGALPRQFEITPTNVIQGVLAHFIFVYALVFLAVTIYNMY